MSKGRHHFELVGHLGPLGARVLQDSEWGQVETRNRSNVDQINSARIEDHGCRAVLGLAAGIDVLLGHRSYAVNAG